MRRNSVRGKDDPSTAPACSTNRFNIGLTVIVIPLLRDQWQSQTKRLMCWVLAGIGISTVRTDWPRAAIASDKQAAVHRRAEAESRTYCTSERLGSRSESPSHVLYFSHSTGRGPNMEIYNKTLIL